MRHAGDLPYYNYFQPVSLHLHAPLRFKIADVTLEQICFSNKGTYSR
jgi:hypothetical protein